MVSTICFGIISDINDTLLEDSNTMVWRTPANKTPRLSSVIVVSCCVQTNSPCHVKSMGIVPMNEWKVTLNKNTTMGADMRPP